MGRNVKWGETSCTLNNSRMMYKEVGIYETACLMDFEDFPFDNQTYSIEVSSIFF